MTATLEQHLARLDPKLMLVLKALGDAVAQIAVELRTVGAAETGSTNLFGDKVLAADERADAIIFEQLKQSGAVETASSEEQPGMQSMGGHGFSVAFDPLDGSSIIGANWAVGSIFGVWPGRELVGRTGGEQAAAVYALYGPRTVLMVAAPSSDAQSAPLIVQEYTLGGANGNAWVCTNEAVRMGDKKVFAPANLRAVRDNPAYRALVDDWLDSKYTLRYSGGLVPDVHHMLAKGGGVFCNPVSPAAPAKLRLLYESAPLAFLVEAAGGLSHDGQGSVLERRIEAADVRTPLSLGSTEEVKMTVPALAA